MSRCPFSPLKKFTVERIYGEIFHGSAVLHTFPTTRVVELYNPGLFWASNSDFEVDCSVQCHYPVDIFRVKVAFVFETIATEGEKRENDRFKPHLCSTRTGGMWRNRCYKSWASFYLVIIFCLKTVPPSLRPWTCGSVTHIPNLLFSACPPPLPPLWWFLMMFRNNTFWKHFFAAQQHPLASLQQHFGGGVPLVVVKYKGKKHA